MSQVIEETNLISSTSATEREATSPQKPIRVLHIITRMIVGGAQENTLLSVEGLDKMPEYEVHFISGVRASQAATLPKTPALEEWV